MSRRLQLRILVVALCLLVQAIPVAHATHVDSNIRHAAAPKGSGSWVSGQVWVFHDTAWAMVYTPRRSTSVVNYSVLVNPRRVRLERRRGHWTVVDDHPLGDAESRQPETPLEARAVLDSFFIRQDAASKREIILGMRIVADTAWVTVATLQDAVDGSATMVTVSTVAAKPRAVRFERRNGMWKRL